MSTNPYPTGPGPSGGAAASSRSGEVATPVFTPAPARRVRALRGATTVDEDTVSQVTERTQALVRAVVEANGVEHADIISVLFTATDDIHCMFPAQAARGIGFGDVPLLCARELNIEGMQPRCIRLLMHIETTAERLHHVYLEGARGLRDDLPE